MKSFNYNPFILTLSFIPSRVVREAHLMLIFPLKYFFCFETNVFEFQPIFTIITNRMSYFPTPPQLNLKYEYNMYL